jgi:myo-inositol 2-dehydrogenase / D-chiro-inositol 1-dehydrogenase
MHDPSLHRRDFVKAAGVGLVLPLIAGSALATPRRQEPLKIGVVGFGGRGTGSTIQALTADKDTILWAVGDVFDDRLNNSFKEVESHLTEQGQQSRMRVPAERRFLGFDAYKHVIDSGVDVVLLTAYPAFRPAHLEYAVEKGKHIFAEKPIAVDAPGVRRVLAACEQAKSKNLSVMSGFCWRYADAEKAAFAKLHDGAIGPIHTVHSTYHTSTLPKRPRKPEWSDTEFQMRNWWHYTWVSGDHVVEQAIHSIDRMSWAMDDAIPTQCIGMGGRAARGDTPEHGHVYDHFTAIYEYADGRRAIHTTRQFDNTPTENADYIYAANGRAVINGFANRQEFYSPANKLLWKYDGPRGDMYQNEHDALFASIRASKAHNDGERMCQTTMLAIMARMAAYTGAVVTWKQAWDSTEALVPQNPTFGPMPMPPVAIPGKTKLT